jgi:Tfp pilus assembly protein PilP
MRCLRPAFLFVTLCVSLSAVAAVAAAQAAPSAAKPGSTPPDVNTPPAPAGAAASAPTEPSGLPYSYQADGRRDPFQSLTAASTDDKAPRPTGAGIAGIRVEELSVRGVMRSRERLVAMITGPDNRTYVVHPGDKLADGVVKSINPQGLVLVQDVNDPRAKEKTREVRKLLRSEDEKE